MSQSRHLGMVWFCRSTLCTCSTNIRNNAQELYMEEGEGEGEGEGDGHGEEEEEEEEEE